MRRRAFVTNLLAIPAMQLLQITAWAQSPSPRIYERLSTTEFQEDPLLLKALQDGVRAMKAITDPQDPKGWNFWWYVHMPPVADVPPEMKPYWNQCPHHRPYFLSWHRAFLFAFERVLRKASNNDNLALPYWDWFANSDVPNMYAMGDENSNPLFVKRAKTKVRGLNQLAFGNTIKQFRFEGRKLTLESLIQDNPHDTVHDQLGLPMANVSTSPSDPIFWAHHAQIDRCWNIWLKMRDGREMPKGEDSYWTKSWPLVPGQSEFTAADTADSLQIYRYKYKNEDPPSEVQESAPMRPAAIDLGQTTIPQVNKLFSLGTTRPISLAGQSISVRLPLSTTHQSIFSTFAFASENAGASPRFTVTLENVALTEAGRIGGYSYGIYVNLPDPSLNDIARTLLRVGTLGPFSIGVAGQHLDHLVDGKDNSTTVTLQFDATPPLVELARTNALDPSSIVISFVREDIESEPQNAGPDLIRVGRIRVDAEKLILK